MNCDETRSTIGAYADGELDLLRAVQVEEHLKGCLDCPKEMEGQRALSTALRADARYFSAPPELAARIRSSLRGAAADTGLQRSRSTRRWAAIAAPSALAAALAAALVVAVLLPARSGMSPDDLLASEVTASHVRSLMVNHLMDVASTDKHTVKPWFQGKLDFSPPVVDLASDNFRLIGGRLDYIGDRAVAALIYQRRAHFINLLIWPATGASAVHEQTISRQGYNLIHWTKSGMTYWAISNISADELRDFVHHVQDQTG